MGERKRKQLSNSELIGKFPICIYCGVNSSTSVDHCPLKVAFQNKDRPRGLEIPACDDCNQGSSHSDIVGSLLSQVMPAPGHPEITGDFSKLLQAAANNLPGLLEEMHVGRAGQKLAAKALSDPIDGGFLRVSGPLATRNMTAFTLKLTTALHFEATGSELPPQAGICARWFSNYDRLTGVFPATIFDDWPPARALEQGKKTTIGQFEYVSRVSSDHSIGAHLATFRFSLAVVGFVAYDKATLLNSGSDFDPQVFSPTELGELLKNLKTS